MRLLGWGGSCKGTEGGKEKRGGGGGWRLYISFLVEYRVKINANEA